MNLAQLIDGEAVREGRHIAPRVERRPEILGAPEPRKVTRKERVLKALADRPMSFQELLDVVEGSGNALSVVLSNLKAGGLVVGTLKAQNRFVYSLPVGESAA